jgi:hypothetical protein
MKLQEKIRGESLMKPEALKKLMEKRKKATVA